MLRTRLYSRAPRFNHTRRLVIALVFALALGWLVAPGGPTPAGAQLPGGTNLTLTPSTTTPTVGQPVTFTYRASPPAVAPPFASIDVLTLDYGDGTPTDVLPSGDRGQTLTGSTTHSYTSAGSFTALLVAKASNGGSGQTTATITVSGSGGGSGLPGGPLMVNLPAGWNLIALPPNSTLPGPLAAPYTYGPNDSAYVQVQNVPSGVGVWQFLNAPSTLSISRGSPQTATVQLPPGHWVMIGNPGSFPATVKGADTVYIYDGSTYKATTTLEPGQGAWAISLSGGTATISN
jgi:PKD domain-containing protein